jgi:hypothetical protein
MLPYTRSVAKTSSRCFGTIRTSRWTRQVCGHPYALRLDISTRYLSTDVNLRKGLYESAYMVVYERVSDVCPVPSVPADLAAKITVENAELQQLRRLYLVQRQLVELTVYFQLQHRGETGYVYDENSADAADASTLSSKRCQIFLLGSATLKEALDQTRR